MLLLNTKACLHRAYQSLNVLKIPVMNPLLKKSVPIGFKTPGPCHYTYPDFLNDSGQYHASWNLGNGKRIMSKEERKSFIDKAMNKTFGKNFRFLEPNRPWPRVIPTPFGIRSLRLLRDLQYFLLQKQPASNCFGWKKKVMIRLKRLPGTIYIFIFNVTPKNKMCECNALVALFL